MSQISASQFKNHLGEFLEKAWQDDIIIQKTGRDVAVLISKNTYDQLKQYEDYYWKMAAEEALKDGMLTEAESMDFLTNCLKKDDKH